jgi:hypothetical protein
LLLGGCKGKPVASSNSPSAPPAVTANSNSPVTSGAQSATRPAEPAKLFGAYEWREVEDKGVVTIITKVKTVMVFTADGNYSRISQRNGKTYHSDSGQFRIEGDKLVLTIQISEKNIKTPPLVKAHKFSLSADGDELKMTSDAGATATYQRTSKPKAS